MRSTPVDLAAEDGVCPDRGQAAWVTGPEAETHGEWGMCTEPKTYRLALGLFSEHETLRNVFAEISALGHKAEHLCLIAQTHALHPDILDGTDDTIQTYFRALFDEMREVRSPEGTLTCIASAGPMIDDVCGRSIAAFSDGSTPPAWLSEKQFRRLRDHISRGGLVLIVSSQSSAQHDAISRVLLCHSNNGVQTHDFTI